MQPDVKYELATCPLCFAGQVFSAKTGGFIPCGNCSGRGKLCISHICACGGPVLTISKDKIAYCGKDACLKDLKEDLIEDQRPTTFRSSQWHSEFGQPGISAYHWDERFSE